MESKRGRHAGSLGLAGGVIESAPDAIVSIDEAQRVVVFNAAAERMFGYSREQVLGKPLNVLIPDRYRQAHTNHVKRFGQTGVSSRSMSSPGVLAGLRADGEEFPIEATISQSDTDGSKVYTAIVRDISQRARDEQLLRDAAIQLQEKEEGERRRIAGEIHDELGQLLTALRMDISLLQQKLAAKLDQHSSITESDLRDYLSYTSRGADLTVAALRSVRNIATQLRPPILDDLGLLAALDWQAKEFSALTGVEIHLDFPSEEPELLDRLKTVIFRVFQESLTNVAKHSKATEVTCRLRISGKGHHRNLELDITDNGIGLGEKKPGTLGVTGMKERAALLRGACEISSLPQQGTTVRLRLPVQAEAV